jgi:cation diffusion facilitator family transporter
MPRNEGLSESIHRHGQRVHSHPHQGRHRHLLQSWAVSESVETTLRRARRDDGHDHGHSHGLVEPSLVRSRAGLRVVITSLAILAITASLQGAIYAVTGSIALLADLIHNAGDALTALPLAAAFLLRSARAERGAGLFVVLAILVSAITAGVFAVERIVNPLPPDHLFALGAAGIVGVIGNAIAARVRIAGGQRLNSAALIADGYHARSDAIVSGGVVLSAVMVALGVPIADPIIGLLITGVILLITRESWRTIRHGGAHQR